MFTDGWSRLAGGLVLALSICAVPSIALGQEGEPTPAQLRAAAEAFDRGREAYNSEHYAEAAEQFERADASAPSSTALDLAMKARDKAGDLDRAGTLAALALERYGSDEAIAQSASEIVQRARAQLYEVTVMCVHPCELADGTQIVHGMAAKQRTLFLQPGEHSLRAGWVDGKTQSKVIEAIAGTNGELSFEGPTAETEPKAAEPVPEPEPEPAPPPQKSKGWSPLVFWIGAGATVAAGGVTAWSGIDTVNNPGKERVQNECAKGDENCALYQEGRAKQARTNVLLGVTSVLAVGTGLIGALAIDWSGAKPAGDQALKNRQHIAPFVSVGKGFSIGARGRF